MPVKSYAREVYNDMEPNGKLIAGKRIKIPKLEWKKKRKK